MRTTLATALRTARRQPHNDAVIVTRHNSRMIAVVVVGGEIVEAAESMEQPRDVQLARKITAAIIEQFGLRTTVDGRTLPVRWEV